MDVMRAFRAFCGKACGPARRIADAGGLVARTRLDRSGCGPRRRF